MNTLTIEQQERIEDTAYYLVHQRMPKRPTKARLRLFMILLVATMLSIMAIIVTDALKLETHIPWYATALFFCAAFILSPRRSTFHYDITCWRGRSDCPDWDYDENHQQFAKAENK